MTAPDPSTTAPDPSTTAPDPSTAPSRPIADRSGPIVSAQTVRRALGDRRTCGPVRGGRCCHSRAVRGAGPLRRGRPRAAERERLRGDVFLYERARDRRLRNAAFCAAQGARHLPERQAAHGPSRGRVERAPSSRGHGSSSPRHQLDPRAQPRGHRPPQRPQNLPRFSEFRLSGASRAAGILSARVHHLACSSVSFGQAVRSCAAPKAARCLSCRLP